MPITIAGSGTITGISAGGLPDGTVQPADLSTGAPSWTSGGDLSFNSGYGSAATAYGCRAWVNFNGTGTVAIRASGNVSSITDNGTGTYSVNFTTTMPDANYCGVITSGFASGVREDVFGFAYSDAPYAPASGAYGIKFVRADTNVAVDPNHAMVAIFR